MFYVFPSDELWPELELLELDFPLLPPFPDPLEPAFPDPLEPAFPDPLEPDFPDALEPDFPDALEPDFSDPLEPDLPDPLVPAFSDPLEPELSFPNLLAPSPSVFVSVLLVVLQDMSERKKYIKVNDCTDNQYFITICTRELTFK